MCDDTTVGPIPMRTRGNHVHPQEMCTVVIVSLRTGSPVENGEIPSEAFGRHGKRSSFDCGIHRGVFMQLECDIVFRMCFVKLSDEVA